jgi:hypothetical protein
MSIPGYVYEVPLDPIAVTAAKTLIQLKCGAAAGAEIIEALLYQTTKTTSELLRIAFARKSAAATVTSVTPLKVGGAADPTALAVGGTSATGVNASAEGTDTDVLGQGALNVLNAEVWRIPIPEGRIWVPAGAIIGLKLFTAPAASMTIGGYLRFREYQ